jgi:hypothetical protein
MVVVAALPVAVASLGGQDAGHGAVAHDGAPRRHDVRVVRRGAQQPGEREVAHRGVVALEQTTGWGPRPWQPSRSRDQHGVLPDHDREIHRRHRVRVPQTATLAEVDRRSSRPTCPTTAQSPITGSCGDRMKYDDRGLDRAVWPNADAGHGPSGTSEGMRPPAAVKMMMRLVLAASCSALALPGSSR